MLIHSPYLKLGTSRVHGKVSCSFIYLIIIWIDNTTDRNLWKGPLFIGGCGFK